MSATIRTRYLSATDTTGSRIRATYADHNGSQRQLTRSLDYALNPPENHKLTAAALVRVPVESLTMRAETLDGYIYRLECSGDGGRDGQNHSSDISVVFSGESLGKPLCGFCAMRSVRR